jgi:hypothetical protein
VRASRRAVPVVLAALLVVAVAGVLLALTNTSAPSQRADAATTPTISIPATPPDGPEPWLHGSPDAPDANWPEDPPLPEQHGGVGDTLTFTDSLGGTGAITLHGIERTTQKAADSTYAPDPEWSYLIFDFTVTGTEGWVAPDYVKLRVRSDHGWHRFNPVPTLVMLNGSPLGPGQSTRGVVGFDVPPGELRIDYNDQNGPVASFVVDG